MKNEILISSPATVANLVCGFDILGLALNGPSDKMLIRKTQTPGVKITHKDDFALPSDPEKNVIGAALLALLKETDGSFGFEVESTKTIKPGSGIGSSAASAAGAVVGANHLLDGRFTKEELVRFAMCGEEVASGTKHADNIAPCIYGGITLIRCSKSLDIITIPAPPLWISVLHPQIEVRTSDARQILKKQISLKQAIIQWANIAGLVSGLLQKDYELISRSLSDVIVEPVRSILIPGFASLKEACMDAGALGGGISGSGPSVFMLSRNQKTALAVEEGMRWVYNEIGLDFRTYVSAINTDGVKILQQD
jgi:homoserine kinase